MYEKNNCLGYVCKDMVIAYGDSNVTLHGEDLLGQCFINIMLDLSLFFCK